VKIFIHHHNSQNARCNYIYLNAFQVLVIPTCDSTKQKMFFKLQGHRLKNAHWGKLQTFSPVVSWTKSGSKLFSQKSITCITSSKK